MSTTKDVNVSSRSMRIVYCYICNIHQIHWGFLLASHHNLKSDSQVQTWVLYLVHPADQPYLQTSIAGRNLRADFTFVILNAVGTRQNHNCHNVRISKFQSHNQQYLLKTSTNTIQLILHFRQISISVACHLQSPDSITKQKGRYMIWNPQSCTFAADVLLIHSFSGATKAHLLDLAGPDLAEESSM